VTGSILRLQRRYEFGPSIVWDALVDADLVAGWLADAVIEAEVGGAYILRSAATGPAVDFDGSIVGLEPRTRLYMADGSGATLRFTLGEVVGGNRGTSTELSVDISSPVEPAFADRLEAEWTTSLDQLGDLLHGHPVDWRRVDGRPGESTLGPVVEGPGSRRHPHG
jgi:uncharacterized protein YndB with AHSA1/START domain